MKKISVILQKVSAIATSIESIQISAQLWLTGFLALIAIRLLVIKFLTESWQTHTIAKDTYFFYEFSHTFLFFFITFLIFLFIFKKILKLTLSAASNVLLFGFLVILTPPVSDHIISKGRGFWSFYELDGLSGMPERFVTFFGKTPEVGMTYGVRIGVAISLMAIAIYGYSKTKKKLSALKLLFISYATFFILGTLPSWITIAAYGFRKGFLSVNEMDSVQLFLTTAEIFSRRMGTSIVALNVHMSIVLSLFVFPLLALAFYSEYAEKIKVFLKNIRLPQILFHSGTFLLGIGLAVIFKKTPWSLDFFNVLSILLMIQSILLVWITSVIVNDLFDQKIDRVSNPDRPLILKNFSTSEYKTIGAATFAASIFFSYVISAKISLLLVAYQALAWVYSAPPFRLKRFPFLSTFVSAIALLTVLFSGFVLASPDNNLFGIPAKIICLFVFSFTFSLPIKDLKDIEGDKKDGVSTIPVVFGEFWGKMIISGGIFLSFVLSVVVINEFSLLWPAIILGGVCFWIVQSSNQNKFITYRNLNWWILSVLFVYTLLIAKSILP